MRPIEGISDHPMLASILLGIVALAGLAALIMESCDRKEVADSVRPKAVAYCLTQHDEERCEELMDERHDPCINRARNPHSHRGPTTFDRRTYYLCMEYGPDNFAQKMKDGVRAGVRGMGK